MLIEIVALAIAAAPSSDTAPLVADDIKTDDDVVRALHEHYTKHEADVAMRDGVKLHLDYWTPKDQTRAWPILMTRTPYSIQPYGIENFPDVKNHRQIVRFAPSKDLIKSGYVFVHEDVRGRLLSEGSFVEVRPMTTSAQRTAHDPRAIDEATDAYDTIDWLVKNVPHNNGRVGIWGISYPGFYAAQAAVDAHPALKAVAPMAPVTDWFAGDDFHHNGAFFLADAFDFEANFGRARAKPTRRGHGTRRAGTQIFVVRIARARPPLLVALARAFLVVDVSERAVLPERAVMEPVIADPAVDHRREGHGHFQRRVRMHHRHDGGVALVRAAERADAAIRLGHVLHEPVDGVVAIRGVIDVG